MRWRSSRRCSRPTTRSRSASSRGRTCGRRSLSPSRGSVSPRWTAWRRRWPSSLCSCAREAFPCTTLCAFQSTSSGRAACATSPTRTCRRSPWGSASSSRSTGRAPRWSTGLRWARRRARRPSGWATSLSRSTARTSSAATTLTWRRRTSGAPGPRCRCSSSAPTSRTPSWRRCGARGRGCPPWSATCTRPRLSNGFDSWRRVSCSCASSWRSGGTRTPPCASPSSSGTDRWWRANSCRSTTAVSSSAATSGWPCPSARRSRPWNTTGST
mmetsp:Transcript_37674/g.96280  ORF Transcript_37674/g.96280 Transcript_37674/m.96280 type:complete len:270 (+) Transcript_37674:74-883(+)